MKAIPSQIPAESHECVVGKYRYALVEGKWQVQKLIGRDWKVVYYCADRYAALKCVRKCRAKAIEWSQLSEEERRNRILRAAQ